MTQNKLLLLSKACGRCVLTLQTLEGVLATKYGRGGGATGLQARCSLMGLPTHNTTYLPHLCPPPCCSGEGCWREIPPIGTRAWETCMKSRVDKVREKGFFVCQMEIKMSPLPGMKGLWSRAFRTPTPTSFQLYKPQFPRFLGTGGC